MSTGLTLILAVVALIIMMPLLMIAMAYADTIHNGKSVRENFNTIATFKFKEK